MPSKNRAKIYRDCTYYHVYNRGAHKFKIFHNRKDYGAFLNQLKFAISGNLEYVNYENKKVPNKTTYYRRPLGEYIDINAFCLMPNHYHLLIYLKKKQGLSKFMQSINTGYVMYYNKKYQHSGTLYEGRYKANMITTTKELNVVFEYIHLNSDKPNYEWSSLRCYQNKKNYNWLVKLPFFIGGPTSEEVCPPI